MSDYQPISVCNHNGRYHDCWTVFKDGTHCLINYDLGEKYVLLTNDPLWKRPEDVDFKIQTMTQETNKRLATQKYIKYYFKAIEDIDVLNKKSNNNLATRKWQVEIPSQIFQHKFVFLIS